MDLTRLLNPRSIAVVGGGAWCRQVIAQCQRAGFPGRLMVVHPDADSVGGVAAVREVAQLPCAPDAAFVGVNRNATLDVVAALSNAGAGGAVCFASGFSEAVAEDTCAGDLQRHLLDAAGRMPILGPNCYGFLNAFDGAMVWPDQHGLARVDRGVAILTQSSNVALNLTMQRRALPVGYMITCGNQAQLSQALIARKLLDDDRVTAIGLHVEGFGDLREWEALARAARARGVAIVVLKVGRSTQAQQATQSHTASIAGGRAGADAFLARLGIAQVGSLTVFLETLKVLHMRGPLAGGRLASVSCSGGEAALIADAATRLPDLSFPQLTGEQGRALRQVLGPMVALANPLDYNTFIWRDTAAMARAWAAMGAPGLDMVLLIVDFPRADRCDAADWECAIEAALQAARSCPTPMAMVATLPELLPEDVAQRLMAGGVVPLCGLDDALAALDAARARAGVADDCLPVLLPGPPREAGLMAEAEAKRLLAGYGLDRPAGFRATSPADAARITARLRAPFVLKAEGHAHKTEAGAVRLNLQDADAVDAAARAMAAAAFLVEEMVHPIRLELLVGIHRDPAHGFVLTLAAGGILAELFDERAHLLLPVRAQDIDAALAGLRLDRIVRGYRGAAPLPRARILEAALALQDFAIAHADRLEEVEINPLLITDGRAIAADALIRMTLT